MFIGNNVNENNIFNGIKHYDGLPLTSRDLHEDTDTRTLKNSLLLDNMVGSGIINPTSPVIGEEGISLGEPAVLLLNGDTILIKDDGSPLIKYTDMKNTSAETGVGYVCIVGWYQAIDANTKVRSYGGVSNRVLENPLIDPDLEMQVSTRYQFRWTTTTVFAREESQYLYIKAHDKDGDLPDLVVYTPTTRSIGNVKLRKSLSGYDPNSLLCIDNWSNYVPATTLHSDWCLKDSEGNYVPMTSEQWRSYLTYVSQRQITSHYIIPIFRYGMTSGQLTELSTLEPIRPKGSTKILTQSTEPTGGSYDKGTIWFNPTDKKIKFYFTPQGESAQFLDPTPPRYIESTTQPSGLEGGSIWYNSSSGRAKLRTSNNFIDLTPSLVKNHIRFPITTDSEGDYTISSIPRTSSNDGILQVYHNGLLLLGGTDYTDSGTSITLSNYSLRNGDYIDCVIIRLG